VSPEKSRYYRLWKFILDEHLKLDCKILDVGCGAGQFARLCIDRGLRYVGVDFSQEAIKIARQHAPEGAFHVVDVAKDQSLLRAGNYDVAVFIEFLEHVENDVEILSSVPKGKKVVLSVPAFMDRAHVRAFYSPEMVLTRYFKAILKKPSEVKPIKIAGAVIYVVSGVRA